ncbi:hypothetical protein QYM36_005889 [Artemia franciscana]|uniref:Uncharacterized protein n=1 Tax=Artemia franciscana TaxID=6661 RepID=A0AA88L6F4_ARTSF|nr:hypothetical protein QYM36_005889 [Artemia franciscana]
MQHSCTLLLIIKGIPETQEYGQGDAEDHVLFYHQAQLDPVLNCVEMDALQVKAVVQTDVATHVSRLEQLKDMEINVPKTPELKMISNTVQDHALSYHPALLDPVLNCVEMDALQVKAVVQTDVVTHVSRLDQLKDMEINVPRTRQLKMISNTVQDHALSYHPALLDPVLNCVEMDALQVKAVVQTDVVTHVSRLDQLKDMEINVPRTRQLKMISNTVQDHALSYHPALLDPVLNCVEMDALQVKAVVQTDVVTHVSRLDQLKDMEINVPRTRQLKMVSLSFAVSKQYNTVPKNLHEL